MHRVIVLHGWEGSPQGNWFPWLKKELDQTGKYQVSLLDLPNPENPQQNEWVDAVTKAIGKSTENLILVGHSLGAATILRYLETLPDNTQIKAAILVGTPTKISVQKYPPIQHFFRPDLNWEKIRQTAKNWFLIGSDNDQYIPFSEIKSTPKLLGQKLIFIKDQGHFNLEFSPKYTKFPYLLKIFNQLETNE